MPVSSSSVLAAAKGSRGFTLIEVAVATVILGIALVAALATYGSELRTLARAREVAVAVELAEDRLAAVKLFAADRLPNVPDTLERGAFPDPFADYSWSVDADALQGGDLAEVTVTVLWPNGEHGITTVLVLPSARLVPR